METGQQTRLDATADTLTFTIALCGCEQPVFDPLENQEDPAYTRADSLAADSTAAGLSITIQSPRMGRPLLYRSVLSMGKCTLRNATH